MTDIVERLRDLPLLYQETGDEAAAVIERLREELADVRADAALLRAALQEIAQLDVLGFNHQVQA